MQTVKKKIEKSKKIKIKPPIDMAQKENQEQRTPYWTVSVSIQ